MFSTLNITSSHFNPANGSYIFVNTRGYPSSVASLQSPTIPYNGTKVIRCLEFWYHMHGQSVNNLDVYSQTQGGSRRALWSRRGTQGDRWFRAEVHLEITGRTRVCIQTTKMYEVK